MTAPLIVRRLDAALAKADALTLEIRAIYLTGADHDALTRWWTSRWRRKLGSSAIFVPFHYRDHPIRRGARSRLYSTHGVGVAVPRRLPQPSPGSRPPCPKK